MSGKKGQKAWNKRKEYDFRRIQELAVKHVENLLASETNEDKILQLKASLDIILKMITKPIEIDASTHLTSQVTNNDLKQLGEKELAERARGSLNILEDSETE